MKNKGFTLVELLVVIAIIGILTSIVVSTIKIAKDKSSDANIKGNLDSIRAQAELYYDSSDNAYATTTVSDCGGDDSLFLDPTIQAAIRSAQEKSNSFASCYASPNAWSVSVPLVSSTGHWCVDNGGYANTISSAISSTSCT